MSTLRVIHTRLSLVQVPTVASPGDPAVQGRETPKSLTQVSFADGIPQVLTAHRDPAVFLMIIGHLQQLSFGLIPAKASKSKQDQQSHTHTQNKPMCGGKCLMTHTCSSKTARQALQAPFGGTCARLHCRQHIPTSLNRKKVH